MKLSLELVKESVFIKINKFFLIVLVILSFTVLIFRLYFDSDFAINIIYAVIIITPYLISSIPLFFKKLKYIKYGLIKFTHNSIEIGNAIYDIDNIENINIVLFGYAGQQSFSRSPNSPIRFLRDGGGNHISFKHDNTKLSFDFLINYKSENVELTQIIDIWKEEYPENIKIKKY